MGYFDKSPGDTLTAANVDTLMLQSIMRFADSSARDTALSGVLAEGLTTYQDDSNTYTYYTGAAWQILSEPTQSWSPTVTQSGSVARTLNKGWYKRDRDTFRAQCNLSFTGSGTATNAILITSPLTMVDVSGWFVFYDTSLGAFRNGAVQFNSSTSLCLVIDEGASFYGVAGSDGITNGDIIDLGIEGRY